jgi:hypothetical protein
MSSCILFECLVKNFNQIEAQAFLNAYNGKLKIKSFSLGTLLGDYSACTSIKPTYGPNEYLFHENKNELDKL